MCVPGYLPAFICPATSMPVNYILPDSDTPRPLPPPDSHGLFPFLAPELRLHSHPEHNLPSTLRKQDRQRFEVFKASSTFLGLGSVPRRHTGTSGEREKGRVAEKDETSVSRIAGTNKSWTGENPCIKEGGPDKPESREDARRAVSMRRWLPWPV